MGTKTATKRSYPHTEKLGGQEFTFRLMTAADEELLAQFTSKLPEDDLLFLRMDITRPEVRKQWCENIKTAKTTTLLALDDKGKIVGYCSLHRNELCCTKHHGELRVFVLSKLRGHGLGQVLVREMFRFARDQKLERIIMNIAREQRGLRQMLEQLDFRVEALLTDWLKARDGKTHDLVIMSHQVEE